VITSKSERKGGIIPKTHYNAHLILLKYAPNVRGKGREGRRRRRVYGLWAVGRRGCDNDRCLTNRGLNRRGERRKNAQSHIGPQGESRTGSD